MGGLPLDDTGAAAPDDSSSEPAPDDSSSEPAPDDSSSEPAPDDSSNEPAPDGSNEPAPDGPNDPGPDDDPGPGEGAPDEPAVAPSALDRVLVFSRTAGFRHDAIGAGIELVTRLGQQNGFAVDATEDPAQFSDQNLSRYDVVVWMSTTGDVLNGAQEQAFERFIRAGGGWVGVHSASDTEYGWGWYGQLLGGNAYFRIHPEIQTAQVDVEIAAHPSTAHLPARFAFQDELYNFRQNPRDSVNVLMTLDESSYSPREGAMGDHPIAWYHEFDGGRAWYTGLGHRIELYTDPLFTRHLLGGIRWAAGVAN
jgi:cytochrome c